MGATFFDGVPRFFASFGAGARFFTARFNARALLAVDRAGFEVDFFVVRFLDCIVRADFFLERTEARAEVLRLCATFFVGVRLVGMIMKYYNS